MQQFYVYVDWTTENSPRPFYVGKGKAGRTKCLLRNKHHANISKSFGIHREIVFETCDESLAFNEEKRLIQVHKTFALGGEGWWGANYTLGGEGTSGAKLPWSEERRANASVIQKAIFSNNDRLEIHRQATRKQWLDDNRRLLQSQRMKEHNPSHTHPDTQITRERKSEGQKRRYQDPLERIKTAERTRQSCLRQDVFEKRSQAQKIRRQREREQNVS